MATKDLILYTILVFLLCACNTLPNNSSVELTEMEQDSLYIEKYILHEYARKSKLVPLLDSLKIYNSKSLKILAFEQEISANRNLNYSFFYLKSDQRLRMTIDIDIENRNIDSSFNIGYLKLISFLKKLSNHDVINAAQFDSINWLFFGNKINYSRTREIDYSCCNAKMLFGILNMKVIGSQKQQEKYLIRNRSNNFFGFQPGLTTKFYYKNSNYKSEMHSVHFAFKLLNLVKLQKLEQVYNYKIFVQDSFCNKIDSTFYSQGGKLFIVWPYLNMYQVINDNGTYKILNSREYPTMHNKIPSFIGFLKF